MKNKQNTFAALKIPEYQIYFGALLMQMAAMNIQMVARSWFMYELTGSAAMLGTVGLASALPMLTVSLFGGVLADRIRKRGILIAGQLASAVISLGIAVAITLGTISWVHLFIAAFLQGLVMSLMMPAKQALIYELVGQETLMNAIALDAAAMNFLRLTAPAFAGFFIAIWSITAVYYIMTGLYLIGFAFAVRLPQTETVRPRESRTVRELKEGLRYTRHNAPVLAILILTLLATILSMPYIFLLPIFTRDIFLVDVAIFGRLASVPLIGPLFLALGKSSARQGLLISISGFGALTGSLVIASMTGRKRGIVFLLSILLSSMALICFSASGSYLIALIMFFPLGLGESGMMALGNTLIQSNTDAAHRGRVMSIYMTNWGITMVGVFLVSILADFIGVQLAVGGAAGFLAAIVVYYLIFSPRVRQLD
ncbi:MAG: MFS transporter [Desulfobacterales bacterium]|nr:MFS transporter [Desulfobacterales bacterium]